MTYRAFAAITVLALLACPARAETVSLANILNAASEVPPNDSKARGYIIVTYDTDSKLMSWSGGFSDLSGEATAGHFHGPAEAGQNAGVAVPIPTPFQTPPLGRGSSFEGSATLTDAQAADLLAGRYYVNIHTAGHPAGEIRGQLVICRGARLLGGQMLCSPD